MADITPLGVSTLGNGNIVLLSNDIDARSIDVNPLKLAGQT